jgi:DNA polymerase elongation subunit (family B)
MGTYSWINSDISITMICELYVNNSGYGAISQSGFLFFDNRIAEGITMTGQFIIQYVSKHFNKRLNDFFKTKDVNYIIYMDTDSSFFDLNSIVKKYYIGKTDEEIVSALDNLMEKHLRLLINEATDHISKAQNYYKETIYFKREKIFSSGFWLAPKKYALKVHDNEGVRYATPDYAITGIEVVRSSTPQIARDALRSCVVHIINKDIESMRDIVKETHTKFLVSPSYDIAFPRGVNNLSKYSSKQTIYTDRTPIAVRGSLLHNHFLEKLNLEILYQPIEEGSKILFLYLKEPNHFRENVISFVDEIPKEFKLEEYVDRELMFDKVFLKPLEGIMKAVGWEIENTSSLDEFF